MPSTSLARTLAAVLLAAATLVACGGDDDSSDDPASRPATEQPKPAPQLRCAP
ncbi:hypothetical protein [Achromobacter xylosoxidans]|uniref:hypothetical protein n=1 Tax=Alcaligenes xylosoxydans xylosoxydans TaxID=85698 RepID=UPI001F148D44|nr:hypothetical protein [Achromobacter xylosoxidans]